jgi:hypothetical protein
MEGPEGKRPLGRPRPRSDDNVITYLPEVDMDWIYPAQVWDRWRSFVNMVMNLRVL